MSEEIAICLVTHNNYWITRYAIENLLSKTRCKTRLYIVDNGSDDSKIIDYCKSICDTTGGYFRQLPEKVSYSVAINNMIRIVYQKYCVLFPINSLVHKDWLEDLYHYHQIIDNPGCLAIRNGFEKLIFMPILHKCDSLPEDELRNILISENNVVEGLFMFEREKLTEIGFFDENLKHKGYEQSDFCFRFSATGLNNIYIRNQSLIKLHLQDDVLFPKRTKDGMNELKEQIDWMIKNQIFKK